MVATSRTGEERPPQLDEAIEELRRTAIERHLPPLTPDEIRTRLRATCAVADALVTASVVGVESGTATRAAGHLG